MPKTWALVSKYSLTKTFTNGKHIITIENFVYLYKYLNKGR